MLCTVYPLLLNNARVVPTDARHGSGRDGILICDRVEGMLGKHAILYDVLDGHEITRLYRADLVVRDGALFITGERMHFRGTKSKGEPRAETWWCVPIQFAPDVRAARAAKLQT